MTTTTTNREISSWLTLFQKECIVSVHYGWYFDIEPKIVICGAPDTHNSVA